MRKLISVSIMFLAVIFLFSFQQQETKEYNFKFSLPQIQQIVQGLQYSKGISSADANELVNLINQQFAAQQPKDTTQKKKP